MTSHMPDRYGIKTKPKNSKRIYAITVGILSAIGVGIAGWFTLANPANFVETTVITFEQVNDHQLRLVFNINMPADRSGVCNIQAMSGDKSITGFVEVPVEPSQTNNRTYDILIETLEPAVTGLISHCFTE